ncbi:MAG: hypothetical protein FJZ43_04060 [Candidatus Staskawiczbacteria bacterium]|nr:hypothetical protein [Candidatus Staskawiczbacteria bacterium]
MSTLYSLVRKNTGIVKRWVLSASDVFFPVLEIDKDLLEIAIKNFHLDAVSLEMKHQYDSIIFKDNENEKYFRNILNHLGLNKVLADNPLFIYPPNVAVIDFMLRHINREAHILEYACGLGNLIIYLRESGFKKVFGYDNYSQIRKDTIESFLGKFHIENAILSKEEAMRFPANVVLCISYFWNRMDKDIILKEIESLSVEYIMIDYSYAPRFIKNFKIVGIYKNLLIVFKRKKHEKN